MHALLVEDDLALGAALAQGLRHAGWHMVWVRRLKEARDFLREEQQDSMLLDLGLPDGEGLMLLRELRSQGETMPIVVLSAQHALDTRVSALLEGADDYLVKPFAITEMLARLQAVTRRSSGFASSRWQIGSLCIDTHSREVQVRDTPVPLSPSEFSLLLELVRKAGRVIQREYLVEYLRCGSFNALEVHIHNLRRKLGSQWVRTVRGVGYLLSTQ
ncbi:response regulator [Aquabacterium sp. A7-Y]|uniref:response regulator n=1 Tax=Aquabacterium sp. A7-Y TaxID=1349605 RepID=UPI00223D8C4B|nr:response regulator [Aquabacterium sp. A7-Y]MCW7539459.1 response regulator [Aquabacterium sp. A7-Y]